VSEQPVSEQPAVAASEVNLPFAVGQTPARSSDGEAASPAMVAAQIYALLWRGFFRGLGWWLLSLPLAVVVAVLLIFALNASAGIVIPFVVTAVLIGLIAVLLLKPVVQHIAPARWQVIAQPFADGNWLFFDTLKQEPEDEADSYHIPRADQSRLLDRTQAALAAAPLDQEEAGLDAQAVLIEQLTEIASLTAAQDFEHQVSFALAADGEAFQAVSELLTWGQETAPPPALPPATAALMPVQAADIEPLAVVARLNNKSGVEEGASSAQPTTTASVVEPTPAPAATSEPAAEDEAQFTAAAPATEPPAAVPFEFDFDNLFPAGQPLAELPTPAPPSQPATGQLAVASPATFQPSQPGLPTVRTAEQYSALAAELGEFATLAEPLLNIWHNQREGLGVTEEWARRWQELAEQWRKQAPSHTIEVEDMIQVAEALFAQVNEELTAEVRPDLERVANDRQQMEARSRQLADEQVARVQGEFGNRLTAEQLLQGELTAKEAKQSEQVNRLEQRERSEEATIKRLHDELRQRADTVDQRIRLAHRRVREAAKVAYHSEAPRLVVNNPGPMLARGGRTDPLGGGVAEVLAAVQRRVRGMDNNLLDINQQVTQIRGRFEAVRDDANAIEQPTFPYSERQAAIKLLATDALKLRGELQPYYEDAVELGRRAEALSRDLSSYLTTPHPQPEEGEEYASARNRLNQEQTSIRALTAKIETLAASQLYNQIDTFVRQYDELTRTLPPLIQAWTQTGRELDANSAGIVQTQAEHQRALDQLNAIRQQLDESEQTGRDLIASRDHEVAEHEANLHERLASIAEDASRQHAAIRTHLNELEGAHKRRQATHDELLKAGFARYLNFDAESMELKAETISALLRRIEANLERSSALVQATQRLLDRCLISDTQAQTLLQAALAQAPASQTYDPANLGADLAQASSYNLQFPVWLTEYKTWLFGKRSYYLLTPVEVAMAAKMRFGGSSIELHARSDAAQALFERRANPAANQQIVRFVRRNSMLASRDGRDNLRAASYELAQEHYIAPLLAFTLRFALGCRNLFDFAPRSE